MIQCKRKGLPNIFGKPFFFTLDADNLLIGILLDIISGNVSRGLSGIKLLIKGVKENSRPRCGDNKDG